MSIFTTAATYHVEVLHTGNQEWTHIHHPDWETSDSYTDTWVYARQVRADHPATSRVRVVEVMAGHPDSYVPVP